MPWGLTNCCFRALWLCCLRASPPGEFKAFILLEMHCKCSIKRDRSSHSSCKFQPSFSASQNVKRLSWSMAASAKDPYLLLISTQPSASNSWNTRNQTSQECLPSPPSPPTSVQTRNTGAQTQLRCSHSLLILPSPALQDTRGHLVLHRPFSPTLPDEKDRRKSHSHANHRAKRRIFTLSWL